MRPITKVKTHRKDIVKNFILVTILSTGVSLIANALTKNSGLMIALIPGIICVLIVAICYVWEYFDHSSYELNVQTVLSIDEEKKIIPIDRFQFSEDLERAVVSVLSENKAYKTLWEDAFAWENDKRKKGRKFVEEFLDYLFVQWISLGLNSYFADFEDCTTEIIGREQMPDVLIKNRVIELISKPYEEREKFQRSIRENQPDKGKIVYAQGEDGVVFGLLEIELPRKSTVLREGDSLVIRNRNFDIRFTSKFTGFSTVLPKYFERFYMNCPIMKVHSYMVNVKMDIRLKPFFLLSVGDWKYLGWLDVIGEKFVNYFSFDEFVNSIGYEQSVTNHILFLNGLKKKEGSDDSREDNHKTENFSIVKVDV